MARYACWRGAAHGATTSSPCCATMRASCTRPASRRTCAGARLIDVSKCHPPLPTVHARLASYTATTCRPGPKVFSADYVKTVMLDVLHSSWRLRLSERLRRVYYCNLLRMRPVLAATRWLWMHFGFEPFLSFCSSRRNSPAVARPQVRPQADGSAAPQHPATSGAPHDP